MPQIKNKFNQITENINLISKIYQNTKINHRKEIFMIYYHCQSHYIYLLVGFQIKINAFIIIKLTYYNKNSKANKIVIKKQKSPNIDIKQHLFEKQLSNYSIFSCSTHIDPRMSQKIIQSIPPISVSNDKLRELLLQGNIFQNDKKVHLINVITQIQNGNKQLYLQFVIVIIQILQQNNQNKKTKQIAFDHITELTITANHWLIKQLDHDLFSRIPEFYDEKDGLSDYVLLWKQMYNGKNDREEFPNLSKTLQRIQTLQSLKLTGKLQKFYSEFNKNMQRLKQKRVQFFEDFDDSQVSESFIDEHRMTEIVYMDLMQIKEIRQIVQRQKLTEQNCGEYLIKMKTFMNLNSTAISGDLLKQFNKQKIWARHFIDHHEQYLKRNFQQVKKLTTSSNNIYLDNEQQCMQIPVGNFHKNNFTIQQVPADESRLTQQQLNNDIPAVSNRLKLRKFDVDYVIEKPHEYQKKNEANIYNRRSSVSGGYERRIFQQVSRPLPEETLLLEESTLLNNISIPIELPNPIKLMTNKTPTNRFTQFPKGKYSNYHYNDNIESSHTSKLGLSSSNNNPFANSKTNYNQQSNTKMHYQNYKQYDKQKIDFHSPIRNRMSEDDLDSQNLADDLIVKPHYYKNLAFSGTNKRENLNKFTTTHHYAKTQLNFYPSQQDRFTLNLKQQQEIYSQQHSPRSGRSNKKRLSELTSQKKQRKTKGSKQNGLNTPQEYAFRPYSMHFRKDSQNFNNFRRNCLQQSFPIYISGDLVISCRLRKVKDSRVQVEIVYQNQLREQLSLSILYKIPKSLKIQKVSKIHRKFNLDDVQCHKFNLRVAEFPLQMCFLQLAYGLRSDQDDPIVSAAHLPLPITIKNFIQTLPSNRQQWLRTLKRLTSQSLQEPYMMEKTFQIDRDVVDPSSLQNILGRQFIKMGVSEGYSVEEFGCICEYKEFNNLMFLLRIAVRVDHIATLSIITENRLTTNQKDFLNYVMEIFLTIFAKYPI